MGLGGAESRGAQGITERSLEFLTVEDQIDRIGFGRFQLIAITAFIAFKIADGMELATGNVIWRGLPTEWNLHTSDRAMFVGISFAGFALGTAIGALSGDFIGRRPLLLLHSFILMPTCLLSGMAQSFVQLLVLRFVVGVAIGLALPTSVSMMTEFTPRKYRASSILAIPGFANAFGACAVIVCGIVMLRAGVSSSHSWRIMLMAGVLPDALGLLLVLFFIPESPRFLLVHNQMQDVRDVLVLIAQSNGRTKALANGGWCQPLPQAPRRRFRTMQSMLDLVSSPRLSHIMSVVVVMWCLMAVGLFGEVFLFTIYIEGRGVGRESEMWLLLLLQAAEILGLLVLLVVIDLEAVGRRKSAGLSAGAAALLAVGAAGLLHLLPSPNLSVFVTLCVLLKVVAIMPFEAMYIYTAEAIPTTHRQAGLCIGIGMSKAFSGLAPALLAALLGDSDGDLVHMSIPFAILGASEAAAALLVWYAPELQPDGAVADTLENMVSPPGLDAAGRRTHTKAVDKAVQDLVH